MIHLAKIYLLLLTLTAGHVLGGISIMAMGLPGIPFGLLALAVGLFGFFGGAFVGMFVVLLADMFGVKRVASAMGMAQLVFALGAMLGSPVAGWLFTASGSYTLLMLVAGGCLTAGGLIMPLVEKAKETPEHKRQLELFE
eukprot:g1990.t1